MPAVEENNSTTVRAEMPRPPLPLRAGLAVGYAVAPPLAEWLAARLFLTPPPGGKAPRPLPGAAPFSLEAAGATVRGERLGEGPPVLLVHGWGGRGAQLASLARPLLDAGCSAIVFDGPAHGASSGGTTSLVRMAAAITAVARRFGARAAVGHSFGGAALGIALSRGLDLDAVALIGAPASPAGFFDDFCDAFAIPARARPALAARIERTVGVAMASLEARHLLPAIDAPALVVHDAHDREIPFGDGETIARHWPGARLLRTEGLGHRRILRDAGVARAVASFLAGHLARCGCGRLASGEAEGEPICTGCGLSAHLADRRGRTVAAAA